MAEESFASGSTLSMEWPLVSRIARTVIVVSLKPNPLLSERGLVHLESSINSSAPVSSQAHAVGTDSRNNAGSRRAGVISE
jgi:hypothetical protein